MRGQNWAGQVAGEKGGPPPSVKVAHVYVVLRYMCKLTGGFEFALGVMPPVDRVAVEGGIVVMVETAVAAISAAAVCDDPPPVAVLAQKAGRVDNLDGALLVPLLVVELVATALQPRLPQPVHPVAAPADRWAPHALEKPTEMHFIVIRKSFLECTPSAIPMADDSYRRLILLTF